MKNLEEELIKDIAAFAHDPYKFVLYAFPWGRGELAGQSIQPWQKKILCDLRDGLIDLKIAFQLAIASGNGIGKSALIAWLILWALCTCVDTRVVVTAGTESQLKNKTWPELGVWHRRCICGHWFRFEATSLHSVCAGHERSWRADMIAWNKARPESFAGLHNKGNRILMVFDEASQIDDVIWDTAAGALTDDNTEIIWIVCGNPTRTSGEFYEAFNQKRQFWNGQQIDSRLVEIVNKDQISKWLEECGGDEDNDWFRVHVRGLFPKSGELQFIPAHLVDAARNRKLGEHQFSFAPVILSLDNAWWGDDEIVIYLRQGLMSKMLMAISKNDDDTYIAGQLARFENEYKADAVFIDQGYGTGVYSCGKYLGRTWILVPFGGAPNNPLYLNKRAEMYGLMRDWLKEGGSLPDDVKICEELKGPEGIIDLKGKIKLESKDDMRKRGLTSPNRADALAITFAYPVHAKMGLNVKPQFTNADEYDPFKNL
jgi:hypothetical protein